jgi:FixJ family two-component response regulator
MIPFDDPRLFLEHVKDNLIALAVIDVWMPQLNGLEVQRRFHDIAPNTP